MKYTTPYLMRTALVSAWFLAAVCLSPAEDLKKKRSEDDAVVLSPFEVSGSFGATVGGAKDSRYFRNIVTRGQFPLPETLTAEGLFSEHDLPLHERSKVKDLLVINGEAMRADLNTKPEVRFLAQIGFSSGLDARAWKRQPLNLIAVVDKSGSMSGQPIELVKQSLHKIVAQLGAEDRLSIVLYGDRSHVYLKPLPVEEANRERLDEAIDGIEIAGSTNMEEGLRVGFALARESMAGFHGATRLIQFTDECPNVGDTSANGFMGMMEAASYDGIGQTTIGVGIQFGAELAAKVSSVRGGNLYYFPDIHEMEKTFNEEFDMLVTELAYDMDLSIRPTSGFKLVGVYGIPDDQLKWGTDGEVAFRVKTLFLSKRHGAIYLAFAQTGNAENATRDSKHPTLARIRLSYQQAGRSDVTRSMVDLTCVSRRETSLGLQRGEYLVSEYLGLKAALTAFHVENDSERARCILSTLASKLDRSRDRDLRKEKKVVADMLDRMSRAGDNPQGDGAPDTDSNELDLSPFEVNRP